MRKKLSLLVLALVALILPLGLGAAAPNGSNGGVDVRWEGIASSPVSKIWIQNLGSQAAEASLESAAGSEVVAIEIGEAVEVPVARLGAAGRLRSAAQLFVLQAPEGFDAATAEIEGAPSPRLKRAGRRVRATVERPGWVRALVSGTVLEQGSTGYAPVASEDLTARVEVAVSFVEADSAVRIRLLDSQGEEVTALTASSAVPVRWRGNLGAIPAGGSGHVEVRVLRGKVQGTATLTGDSGTGDPRGLTSVTAAVGGGQGYFNYEINWSFTPDLYYSVAGAPANTCGTLWAYRNSGPWTSTPGWICTDNNGNATKGPWSWANQAGDEDAWAYIEWPNSTTTNSSHHIWDKTCATTTITSSGSPPSSFAGAATDGSWGAGFNANWTGCWAYFYNSTTGSYWTPSAGWYSTNTNVAQACTVSGMPGRTVTWSSPSIPPGYTHQSGHCYQWTACVDDGACGYCDTHYFCT